MEWYEQYIKRVPGVQGGEPIIAGTRTPVRSVVVQYFEVYRGDLAEVQRALLHLTETQINAAIAYYAAHRAEIDADIEAQKAAFHRLAGV